MNRNVEVKVRVGDLAGLAVRLGELRAEDRGVLVQKDTTFHVESEAERILGALDLAGAARIPGSYADLR